jgi:hypothetical protein
MEQVPYRGPTSTERHRTKYNRHSDLTAGHAVPVQLEQFDCRFEFYWGSE